MSWLTLAARWTPSNQANVAILLGAGSHTEKQTESHMDEMHIVEGDLEYLAAEMDNTGQDVADATTAKDLADAPSAMPGSTSASQAIPDAGNTTDKRLRGLSELYHDLSQNITGMAQDYRANEDKLKSALAAPGNHLTGGSLGASSASHFSSDLKSRME